MVHRYISPYVRPSDDDASYDQNGLAFNYGGRLTCLRFDLKSSIILLLARRVLYRIVNKNASEFTTAQWSIMASQELA